MSADGGEGKHGNYDLIYSNLPYDHESRYEIDNNSLPPSYNDVVSIVTDTDIVEEVQTQGKLSI